MDLIKISGREIWNYLKVNIKQQNTPESIYGKGRYSMTTSKAKRIYNKASYTRYEFSVRKDSTLNYILEEYRNIMNDSLSNLIKQLLCRYFEIGIDDIYVPFHISLESGRRIEVINDELGKIFENLKVKHSDYNDTCNVT